MKKTLFITSLIISLVGCSQQHESPTSSNNENVTQSSSENIKNQLPVNSEQAQSFSSKGLEGSFSILYKNDEPNGFYEIFSKSDDRYEQIIVDEDKVFKQSINNYEDGIEVENLWKKEGHKYLLLQTIYSSTDQGKEQTYKFLLWRGIVGVEQENVAEEYLKATHSTGDYSQAVKLSNGNQVVINKTGFKVSIMLTSI